MPGLRMLIMPFNLATAVAATIALTYCCCVVLLFVWRALDTGFLPHWNCVRAWKILEPTGLAFGSRLPLRGCGHLLWPLDRSFLLDSLIKLSQPGRAHERARGSSLSGWSATSSTRSRRRLACTIRRGRRIGLC